MAVEMLIYLCILSTLTLALTVWGIVDKLAIRKWKRENPDVKIQDDWEALYELRSKKK